MHTLKLNFIKDLFRNKISAAALCVFLFYLAAAVSAALYQIYCAANGITPIYELGNFSERYMPPDINHIFGTDYLGRDVFIRALFGCSTAMKVGFIASVISGSIGVILGLLAGYFRGKTDAVVVWLYSTFASIPSLLFILSFALLISKGFLYKPLIDLLNKFAAATGTELGMTAVYLGIGLTGWVTLCRVVRAEVMKVRETGYVKAAEVLDFSAFRIITKHILPNVFHLIIIYSTMRFAYAIMTEVIVSYLGLGVQSAPSWGIMISDGQQRLWRGIWWEVAGATFFMFFLVLSLHILGDSLRDILDPKLKEREQ